MSGTILHDMPFATCLGLFERNSPHSLSRSQKSPKVESARQAVLYVHSIYFSYLCCNLFINDFKLRIEEAVAKFHDYEILQQPYTTFQYLFNTHTSIELILPVSYIQLISAPLFYPQ